MAKTISILSIIILVLLAAFFAINNYIYQEKQGARDYKDATYLVDGEPVVLNDGVHVVPAAPGSASTITTQYFGNEVAADFNGDGTTDVAFVLTRGGGGSGVFFYAVAALKVGETYQGTNAILLGDRIAPQTTEFRDGEIIVNYADRKPGEAMTTAPSVGVSKYMKVVGDKLESSGLIPYSSDEFGISFAYPNSYFLTEHDTGSPQRRGHTITLIEDTPGNRALVSGEVVGEGPPAITIQLFQNDLDHYSTESWIRGTNDSNFKLSPEGMLASTTIDGAPALSYRWSGLYEGTTIAQARPKWIYAFSVTYLEIGADIVQDFVQVRDSVRIASPI